MTSRHVFAFAFVAVLAAGPASAQHQVTTRSNIEYVEHDGVKLTGDLYMPKDVAKAPIVIGIHGGGWQGGSPAAYRHWGPLYAKHGIGLFAIKYRLAKAGTYPKAAYDVKAAIQFVRAKAAELGADPDRIGLQGDSAGGHLASLVGIAPDQFKSEHQNAPHAAVPAGVKTVVSFYGIYDMLAQWQHDQIARPRDQISEKFLGATPMQNRKLYFEVLAGELRHRRPQPHALPAGPRHRRRHRRQGAGRAVLDRAQPGRLLFTARDPARRRALLLVRSARHPGQLQRDGGAARSSVPARTALRFRRAGT